MKWDELKPGAVVDGRFALERPLGTGSFGAVWSATDRTMLDRRVALKILHPHIVATPRALARFQREAEALLRLDHPAIAQPVAFSSEGELAYLATELVLGETLDEAIDRHAATHIWFEPAEIAQIVGELAAAIDYAHARGIIHRDLKPANVMIGERAGRVFVKVLDFGIAKLMDGSASDATTQGRVMGSPLWMSPEQACGDPVTEASDIFALGSIAFELLTLCRAWARDVHGRFISTCDQTAMVGGPNKLPELLGRIICAARPKPSAVRPELACLDLLIERATAIDPSTRPASALDLFEALERALSGVHALTLVAPRDPDPAEPDDTSTISPNGPEKTRTATAATPLFEGDAPTERSFAGDSRGAASDGLRLAGATPQCAGDRTSAAPRASRGIEPTMAVTRMRFTEPRRTLVERPGVIIVLALSLVASALATSWAIGLRWSDAEVPVATDEASAKPQIGAPNIDPHASTHVASIEVDQNANAEDENARSAHVRTPSPAATDGTHANVRAAADRHATPTASTDPSPAKVEIARLRGQLEAAKRDIESADLIALGTAIERAAQAVPDIERRQTISRMARVSSRTGNLAGLEAALRDLAATNDASW